MFIIALIQRETSSLGPRYHSPNSKLFSVKMIEGGFGRRNYIIAPTVFTVFRPRFYFSVKMSFIQQIGFIEELIRR